MYTSQATSAPFSPQNIIQSKFREQSTAYNSESHLRYHLCLRPDQDCRIRLVARPHRSPPRSPSASVIGVRGGAPVHRAKAGLSE